MDKQDKTNRKLSAVNFCVIPYVVKIVDALRNRRNLNVNELGQYGVEIAQDWSKHIVPHDWELYDPTAKKKVELHIDSICLAHIIKRTARDVSYVMGSRLKPILKRMGLYRGDHKAGQELWFILDAASFSWLRAYHNKIVAEKNKKAGVGGVIKGEYPVQEFDIKGLATRILDEPLLFQSKDVHEQLNPIADTIAETMDRLKPEMKYSLVEQTPDMRRDIHFIIYAFPVFDAIENELCLMYASSRLAREQAQTPEELCCILRRLVQEKMVAMAE